MYLFKNCRRYRSALNLYYGLGQQMNGYKYSRFILLSGVVLASILFHNSMRQRQSAPHNFTEISSFHAAEQSLALLQTGDIVFFDVDDTLISTADFLPRQFNAPFLFKAAAILRYPRLLYDPIFGENIFSKMLLKAPRILVEPSVINIITKLRAQGIIVMVITGMETGAFGLIPSMPAWRASMLEDLGVTLETQFEDTVFKKFPPYRGNYPVLYKGLLCCNQRPKGEIIAAFLEYAQLQPQQIVHFDDTAEELESTRESLKNTNIKVLGFHYTGTAQIKHECWSIWRGLKQLKHLIEFDTWIPDKIAK